MVTMNSNFNFFVVLIAIFCAMILVVVDGKVTSRVRNCPSLINCQDGYVCINNKCIIDPHMKPDKDGRMPADEVSLWAALERARDQGMDEDAIEELALNFTIKREKVTAFVEQAIKDVVIDKDVFEKILSAGYPSVSSNEFDKCHGNVLDAFFRCAPTGSNIYALKFSLTFLNFCYFANEKETEMIKYLNQKCSKKPLFENVL